MLPLNLCYLRDIHRQLAGNIGSSVGNGMAGHLLHCIQHLIASLIVQSEDDASSSGNLLALCRENLPLIRESFDSDIDARPILSALETACLAADIQEISRILANLSARLVGRNEEPAQRLLSVLVEHEATRWLRIDEAALSLSATGSQADREIEPFDADERERLLEMLRKQCGEVDELKLTKVKSLAGGFSKQTIIASLGGNRVLPNDVVIRRDRPESPALTTVVDEYELLRALHAAGVAVPRPFAIDEGFVAGSSLMVMSCEAGNILGDPYDIFDHSKPLAVPTLARQLAKVHTLPLSQLTRPLPGHDLPHLVQLRAEIDAFYRDWKAADEASIVIETAFEWVYSRYERFDGERCITHHDLRYHNVLCDETGVTAIIDWELAAVGRAARDLGYLYHHVVQIGNWERFLADYAAAGGIVPSKEEIDFYILWSDLFVAIYMYKARASYLGSANRNIQLAYAGERMRQHNLRILSERMCLFLRESR